MNALLRRSCLFVIGLGLTVTAHAQFSNLKGVDTSKPGIMNDLGFRGIATAAPVPTYPATSLARKITGVAVVAILLDRDGHLQNVNVLQAADEAIGQSVRDALMQWRFRPIGVPMKGKLFFYFTIKNGTGSVASPEQIKPAIAHDQNSATKQSEDAVNQITDAQLEVMRKTAKPNILDIRDRASYQKEHRSGAVNIPFDEVWPRASIELPVAPIVVDCYPQQSSSMCRAAAQILSYSGFDKISVLAR